MEKSDDLQNVTSSDSESIVPMPELSADEIHLTSDLKLERFGNSWRPIGEFEGWRIEKADNGYELLITNPNGKKYRSIESVPGSELIVPEVRRDPKTGRFEIYLRGEEYQTLTRETFSARGETWDLGTDKLEKHKLPDVIIASYLVERHDFKEENVVRLGFGVWKGEQTKTLVAVCESGKLLYYNEKWEAWRPWIGEVSKRNAEKFIYFNDKMAATLYNQGAKVEIPDY